MKVGSATIRNRDETGQKRSHEWFPGGDRATITATEAAMVMWRKTIGGTRRGVEGGGSSRPSRYMACRGARWTLNYSVAEVLDVDEMIHVADGAVGQ